MKTFTNFSSFMEGCCQGITSYFGTRLPRFDSLSLVSRQSVLAILLLCLTLGVGVENAWGDDIELTQSSLSITGSSYSSGTKNRDGVTFAWDNILKNGTDMQVKASTGVIYNSTLVPGKITRVTIGQNTNTNSSTIYFGTSSQPTTNSSTFNAQGDNKMNAPSNNCFGYFRIKRGSNVAYFSKIKVTYTPATITLSRSSISGFDYSVGSGPSATQTFTVSGSEIPANLIVTAPTNYEVSLDNSSWGSTKTINITLTGSASAGTLSSTTVYVRLASGKSAGSYNGNVSIAMSGCNTISGVNPKTVAVSGTVSAAVCSANPSVGTASLNGSVSWISIPLQASLGDDGGTGCTITDAGFVWQSGGSDPTISNNKTAGTYNAGNITGTITGSFSTGVTYKIKAYATNGHGDGLSSSSFTLIPRSVTFDLNGHGTTAPDVQYVNNGDLATDPSYSESVTGYTFGGWYDNSDWTQGTQWNFGSSTVSGGNVTLYAKWTAKTTTVSFNQNSGTGGQTGTLTATYGSAMPGAPVTCPTRTGYNFGGYYDGSGGTGTQYYTNAGASARSWDKDAATATLYAKWTAKSFTVTWMVNGVAYTPSGSGGTDGSTSVDFGSHVATLPTAPTPPCGDKFVGWSTTNIGAVGQATDAGLNLFTTAGDAPVINAEGAVTYYAVFADYDD